MSPVLDFATPAKDPSEWEGAVHFLTVTAAEPPDGPFDNWHLEYEIAHPWSCKQASHYLGFEEYTCDVAYHESESGLAFCLHYSGTPVTKPGFYLIQGWGRKYVHWELGPEYDASIGVISSSV